MYQMIGTWTVLDPKGNQIHGVFASPGASDYFRRNKKFADGTVLVKEIYGTDQGQMTAGNVNWAANTQVVVCSHQGLKGALPKQSLMGQWVGLAPLQGGRAGQAGCDRLQEGLPPMSRSCTSG